MNLVTRFLAARRGKLLMKLGCWLVCFSLVLGLILPQQKAEALVAELSIAAVASVAAAYLGACGMTFITQGMDKDALVSTTQRLIQEFLDTELGGITIQDWLGSVWSVFVLAGKIVMGRPLTKEMMGFAQWVAGKYATQAGENMIYNLDGFRAYDGTYIELGVVPSSIYGSPFTGAVMGTNLIELGEFYLTSDSKLSFRLVDSVDPGNGVHRREVGVYINGSELLTAGSASLDYMPVSCCFCIASPGYLRLLVQLVNGQFVMREFGLSLTSSDLNAFSGSFGLDRSESMSYIPEGIKEGEGVAIDTGAASTMDLDQVLQGVLDKVLAGTLAATMTAVAEGTENPPVEDEIIDVDNLGLPALGAALTSRFPFSIPWDFFRAVQLLAAPAKAPYFEVDFMEPLADDVGGWQGDTTVILDFSEYAIIGQISRWTSTIGFCLMLAGATKRLIWTA